MNRSLEQANSGQRDAADELGELHVLFTSASHLFAVTHEAVDQMVTLPEVVAVPNAHPAVRGVINLRGAVIGLVDLRRVIGQRSAEEDLAELVSSLTAYRHDHEMWLDALDAAADGAPFAGEVQASACAFGRFLAEMASGRRAEGRLFNHFGRAHDELHRAGADVLQIAARGEREAASLQAGRLRRTTGSRLAAMFADVEQTLRAGRRDIALVLRQRGRAPLAVQVDAVETVDRLVPADGPDLDGLATGGLYAAIAKDAEDRLVTVLDPDRLFGLVAA